VTLNLDENYDVRSRPTVPHSTNFCFFFMDRFLITRQCQHSMSRIVRWVL